MALAFAPSPVAPGVAETGAAMDFDLSAEQRLLKAQARRLLDEHADMARVRRVLDDPDRFHDAELWETVAAQGWLGAGIPEAYGGLGLSPLETCVIAEELGRALAPIPFSTTRYLFAEALLEAGDEAQKSRLLPAVATGQTIGCLALSERPGAAAAPAACRVEGGRIYGVKLPVLDGMIARHAVVSARGEAGTRLFLVDLCATGVGRRPLGVIDPTRGAAELDFDGAPAEPLRGAAEDVLARVHRRAAVYLAFEQIGGADRCLEMARDYALLRRTFGAPIGRYQAVKHKLADVYVANELARSNAYYAAWALCENAPELPLAAAAARVAACEAFWQASKENIQVHGGVGFTWEMDCHLHFRRAHLLSLMIGDPQSWKLKLYAALAQSQTSREARP